MCYYALRTPFSFISLCLFVCVCHTEISVAAAIKYQIQSTRIYTLFFLQTIQSHSALKKTPHFSIAFRILFNFNSFGAPFDAVDSINNFNQTIALVVAW